MNLFFLFDQKTRLLYRGSSVNNNININSNNNIDNIIISYNNNNS